MKKILFVMAAFFGCITVSNAQSTLVATLSHGSDVSMFYGAYALRDALTKAESGDIINLSNGAFQATDIKNGITLRGAGIDNSLPTYIVNDFSINIPSDDVNRFTMEGIRCTGSVTIRGSFLDPCFLKCQFKKMQIGYSSTDFIENVMFANCKITDSYDINYGTAQFVNCYLGHCQGVSSGSAATFLNCVMRQGADIDNLSYSHLYNCIIYNSDNYDYYSIPSNSLAFNSIAINYKGAYNKLVSHPNCTTSTLAEVFKTFTGEYSDNESFELTDEAKTKFLGTDGTQVGLYGGMLSYNSTPSYPQFTKMTVDGKTTTDGKLGVDIQVGAGQ